MFPLHRLVFPGPGRRHDDLYLRPLGGAVLCGPELRLPPGAGFTADTYFGVFPLALWRRLTAIGRLELHLDGQGECRIALRGLASGAVLAGFDVALDGATAIPLDAATLRTAEPGLFIELTALTATRIGAVCVQAETPPRRDLHLGLVVTTYRRPGAVRETIARLSRLVAARSEPEYGRLSLVVVDNGSELDPGEFPGVAILPNPNFGGAGGFARGLSHLFDMGATHGVFMDDDAATEEECILRTRRLLAHATDPDLAISAAMLRAETSFMMHEQGAIFEWGRNHRIISRKNGLDLRRRDALLRVLQPEPVGYGGWWFFAFPLRPGMRYPYPLFVRGDDWLFSYLNGWRIETMPGLCSWQEGFEAKIGPAEQYLATKAFLVAELLLRHRPNRLATLRFFAVWTGRNIFGFCYDRARMNLAAIADVLQGPSFWEQNVDLGRRLAGLAAQLRWEIPAAMEVPADATPARAIRPERWRKFLLRAATLNGHLLPRILTDRLARRRIEVRRIDAPQPRFAFPHAEVGYVDAGQGFVARRSPGTAFALLARLAWRLARLALAYSRLRRDYLASVDRLCTRAWWDAAVRSAGSAGPPDRPAESPAMQRRPVAAEPG